MCASVATDMCGLSNPILCCLFLLQVNYVYVYFKKRIKRTRPHTHTHRTTVKLRGTHHSVAQWDECDRVMHTEKISETMTPQSEAYNFVLCSLGSTNKKKKKKRPYVGFRIEQVVWRPLASGALMRDCDKRPVARS